MTLRWLSSCCALLLVAANSAHAYSSPEAYASPSNEGGGGGRWFSGSPAEGYTCNVCHVAAGSGAHFPLRVSGLPRDGYVAGQTYDVLLDWPEFAQRWREIRPDPKRAPPGMTPAMGLVAEFVAESGAASGAIELDDARANPTEQCERVRENLAPRLAAKLFQVRSGTPPFELRPTEAGVLRCESKQLGQRCLIALSSCGASQLRVRWTPAVPWDGPIWFSAGFVATERVSGTSADDSVDAIVVPLVQHDAASGRYRSELGSSCSAVLRPAFERIPSAWGLVAWVSIFVLLRRRAA